MPQAIMHTCVTKLCVQLLYSCCPVWQLVVHLLRYVNIVIKRLLLLLLLLPVSRLKGQRSSSITAETKSVSYLPKGRLKYFKTGTPIEHALSTASATASYKGLWSWVLARGLIETYRVGRIRRSRSLSSFYNAWRLVFIVPVPCVGEGHFVDSRTGWHH